MRRYGPQMRGHCACGCMFIEQSGPHGPVCPHCDIAAAVKLLNASEGPWRPKTPDPSKDTTMAAFGRQEGTQP